MLAEWSSAHLNQVADKKIGKFGDSVKAQQFNIPSYEQGTAHGTARATSRSNFVISSIAAGTRKWIKEDTRSGKDVLLDRWGKLTWRPVQLRRSAGKEPKTKKDSSFIVHSINISKSLEPLKDKSLIVILKTPEAIDPSFLRSSQSAMHVITYGLTWLQWHLYS